MKKLAPIALLLATGLALGGACSKDEDHGDATTGGTNGEAGLAGNGGEVGQTGGLTGTGASAGGNVGTAGGGGTAGGSGTAGSSGTGVVFPPGCGLYGDPCLEPSDCCSELCEGNSCASTVTSCSAPGATCGADTDCCNLNCVGTTCAEDACTADGTSCGGDDECCSGTCSGGTCAALNAECRTAGNPCDGAAQCCSGLCTDGFCARASSFCVQNGDVCRSDQECCSADCTLGPNGVGTCTPIDIGSANCDGLEGMLCDDCNDCCSRVCAPYGATGVNVCQPARGCRVMGDLCRADSDCCGVDGTGLPGEGNVTCLKNSPDDPVGICRSPLGCSPQGNVCHYQNYVCGNSSSRNNCCGATGESAKCTRNGAGDLVCGGTGFLCQPDQAEGDDCESCLLDPFGVPRCNGLGECRQTGETCSSAADCCEGMACVPDDQGVLRCGSTICIESGDTCTVDADCCVSLRCLRPVGSTRGTCDPVTPPPTGGAPGTGGSGGTPNGGAPGTGGVPTTGGTTSCALYGQTCSVNDDCCNGVPCLGGRCLVLPG